jgi:hypothetical protein
MDTYSVTYSVHVILPGLLRSRTSSHMPGCRQNQGLGRVGVSWQNPLIPYKYGVRCSGTSLRGWRHGGWREKSHPSLTLVTRMHVFLAARLNTGDMDMRKLYSVGYLLYKGARFVQSILFHSRPQHVTRHTPEMGRVECAEYATLTTYGVTRYLANENRTPSYILSIMYT